MRKTFEFVKVGGVWLENPIGDNSGSEDYYNEECDNCTAIKAITKALEEYENNFNHKINILRMETLNY